MLRLSLLLLPALIGGCTATVRPPEVAVRSAPVTVEIGDSGGGRFCPPGQAKKGRC